MDNQFIISYGRLDITFFCYSFAKAIQVHIHSISTDIPIRIFVYPCKPLLSPFSSPIILYPKPIILVIPNQHYCKVQLIIW